MQLFLLILLIMPFGLSAATLTATLKPSAINLGNSTLLKLRCEGGIASTVEQTSTPRSLALSFVSSGQELSLINGRKVTSSVFTYRITPRIAGRYIVPPFKTVVSGKEIRSEALRLTVYDEKGNNTPKKIGNTSPPALLRLKPLVNKVYVGEVFPISMELLSDSLRQNHLPVPQLTTEGIRFTRIRPQYRIGSGVSLNGHYYSNVFIFDTGAIAMKPGKLNVLFELEVTVWDHRADINGRKSKLHLTSDPIVLDVIPLPKEGQPKSFTGAVGQLQMTTSAKPNRVEVGEPIELSVTLSGQGALDNT
ncbi:MAG: BatD family protein, partial [Verrucomicrobiota bacterium]|nr:BatD family protein [Verrucomicrobiota bacterium]